MTSLAKQTRLFCRDTYVGHTWKGQEVANERNLPQEVEDHWEEVAVTLPKPHYQKDNLVSNHPYAISTIVSLRENLPEEVQESKCFH